MDRIAVAGAVLCLLAGQSAAGAAAQTAFPRVRGVGGDAQALIDAAFERSPTVRRLAAQIDRSDVIAYVELSLGTETATTRFVRASGPVRYVRITLNIARSRDELMGLLGHELQHVVEIAGEPGIRSDASFAAHYRRIGISPIAMKDFETAEAQRVGRLVRREVDEASDRANALRIARPGPLTRRQVDLPAPGTGLAPFGRPIPFSMRPAAFRFCEAEEAPAGDAHVRAAVPRRQGQAAHGRTERPPRCRPPGAGGARRALRSA